MPTESYYVDLDLADALQALAEHHHEHRTRHLSGAEYQILMQAAEALRTQRQA